MTDELRGLDRWIEREREDRDARPPVAYQCRECDWHGRALAAFEHHQATHHRIRVGLTNFDAVFSCCKREGP